MGDKEVMKFAEICNIDKREAVSDFRLHENSIRISNFQVIVKITKVSVILFDTLAKLDHTVIAISTRKLTACIIG